MIPACPECGRTESVGARGFSGPGMPMLDYYHCSRCSYGWQPPQKDTLNAIASMLLSELPTDTVVWTTADGIAWTAAKLSQEIMDKTDIGVQYMSDLLRVSRDFIARQAKKGDVNGK